MCEVARAFLLARAGFDSSRPIFDLESGHGGWTRGETDPLFAWESIPARPEFDLTATTNTVSNLDDENWRYETRDMTTAAIVDRRSQGNQPACIRFFRLREGDDVPHKMDLARATAPIEIAEGEAITDWTHVVIWPDEFAAHDPHRDAPTLTRVAAYFRDKADERVAFLPLFDRNLIDRLRRLDELRAVDLRVAKADALQDAEDRNLGLFEGVFNMARQSESATLATKLSVGRSRTRHLSGEVKDDVVRLFEVASEFLDHLVVTGVENNRTVKIDLVNERIERKKSVPRATPRVRQPEPQAMYDAIIALRRELDDEGALDAAARGRVA